jgi:hypothetical protein
VRQLALVAVRALGEAGRSEEVMAAALGGALLGVAPFWIRHCSIPFDRPHPARTRETEQNLLLVLDLELVSQTRQRIPTRIRRCLIAGAGDVVPILTAARAEALAVRLAEGSGRQGEQHLLAHDILQQKTALFIIPDFGLVGGNCVLPGLGVHAGGPEDQVELSLQRLGNRFNAPGAQNLKLAGIRGPQPDVLDLIVTLRVTAAPFAAVVFHDQVGLALYGQLRDLADVGAVVQHTGSYGFVDRERLIEELNGRNKHELRVGLCRGGVK